MKENFVLRKSLIIYDKEYNKLIFTSTVGIKKESDKEAAMAIFYDNFEIVKQAIEEAFLESAEGNLFSFVSLDEGKYTFNFYMKRSFYDKHIGNLVEQQSNRELNRLLAAMCKENE